MPIVRKEEILDSWSVLIGGAQGRAGEIFDNTNNFIRQTKVPNVGIQRKAVAPGILRGLFGTKRDFLIVTETENSRLRPYQMFIGARDYGSNLDVYWYLLYRPSFRERLLAFFLFIPILNLLILPFAFVSGLATMAKEKRGGLGLDFFDEQDLRAYVTNAHHCLLEVVDKLMTDLHQDPSRIDRKSRGFLGIS